MYTTVPKVHQGDRSSPKGGYLYDRRAIKHDEERRVGGGRKHGKGSAEKQRRKEAREETQPHANERLSG